MPIIESPIRRSIFFGGEAIKKSNSDRNEGGDGSLQRIATNSIVSGRLSKFYEDKVKFSFPKVLQIVNTEFKYRDYKFPPNSFSLGACINLDKDIEIKWKRPRDIVKDPKFFIDGSSQFDIVQGKLQNSWFLAAVSSFAERDDLLQQVVPMDQSFDERYAGIFRFRFWQYGKWVDVVVDDYLPTYKVNGKRILFGARSAPEGTFWLPLLEKAYAKLHGSYHAIESSAKRTCRSGDAMEDFTGGISDYYTPLYDGTKRRDNNEVEFYGISKEALENKSLITCYMKDSTGSHHYSVKGFDDSGVKVVRIRHLDERSTTSKSISEKDFNGQCASVEICHLELKEFDSKSSNRRAPKTWQLCEIDGEWRGNSAAGKNKENNEMGYNPRYCFELEKKGNVIISLMQKPQSKNDSKIQDPLRVGFYIYQVPKDMVIPYPLDETFSNKAGEVIFEYYGINYRVKDKAETWNKDRNESPETAYKIPGTKAGSAPDSTQREGTRESNCRLKFEKGRYCVVVHDGEKREGDFLLRIFSENP